MPIETSPIPFTNLHLPYTPLFDPTTEIDVPPHSSVYGGGGAGGSIFSGHAPPGSAYGSGFAPAPSGIAGPYTAIPALPDAGYTSPGIHPGARYPAQDDGRSVYAGASMYNGIGAAEAGGPGTGGLPISPGVPRSARDDMAGETGEVKHRHPPSPLLDQPHTASQHGLRGWSASLPGPRRAAPLIPAPQQTIAEAPSPGLSRGRSHEREIASAHLSPQGSYTSPPALGSRTRRLSHGPPSDRYHTEGADDTASDASYYAHPSRARRVTTARPPSPTTAADVSDPHDEQYHLHRRAKSFRHPRPSHAEHMSPRTPGREPLGHIDTPSSPRPSRITHSGNSIPSPTGPEIGRHRALSKGMRMLSLGDAALEEETDRARRVSKRTRKASQLAPVSGSVSDAGSTQGQGGRPRSRSSAFGTGAPTVSQPGHAHPPNHPSDMGVHADTTSPYHAPELPIDTSPLLSPHWRPAERRPPTPQTATRSRQHSYLRPSATPAPPPPGHTRRRSVSMSDRFYAPPQPTSPSAIMPNPFLSPQPSPTALYDDSASVAGSSITFMDGPQSQYGLPKYAHAPKVDYRRFCVQRGKADVFLG